MSEQIRYGYRIKPEWRDFQIKNTLAVSHPRALLQPQAVCEMFYEDRDKRIMLNRVKLGISIGLKKSITIGPYCRFDYSKTGSEWDWTRRIIGFQITLNY